jgi:hypothetical protein
MRGGIKTRPASSGETMIGQKSEDDWQAECDARTIIDADAIKADVTRMAKAKAAAERMLEEEKQRMESLKKLTDAKLDYNKSPKP